MPFKVPHALETRQQKIVLGLWLCLLCGVSVHPLLVSAVCGQGAASRQVCKVANLKLETGIANCVCPSCQLRLWN